MNHWHILLQSGASTALSCVSPFCLQDLKFVGMMQYDGDLLLPANYLVPPPEIHKTSGEFLVHNGISTFACSETQKFGHVTFFWNGNRSGYFDSNLETYLEVSCQGLGRARGGSQHSHDRNSCPPVLAWLAAC